MQKADWKRQGNHVQYSLDQHSLGLLGANISMMLRCLPP